ncbi:malto-oligosyltrehalose synthase [Rubellimicrobium aerolatum]|uniref:Malto-oligosyltrehalose synthase n=1 Tax=Rubellimicrobium aerolatum TaxID=490979 RepID=A0ABW0SFW7_9RHOB|nr:malto-oligosyltrehalose synthase [Rubellimicrobium aerolatum]MBP1806409.1 (1->4)-alpha-D-glucan 1-alpha-D-glucosylmutase [Rubellimicrobium aerolatum]
MTLPRATYRLQLREGMTFERVLDRLGPIRDLGASHLYLSPIFTATTGSTHGYDVTDPGEIDPTLGGREGFEALVRAARDHGLGVILDIVPNHTAFNLENPWLLDVLRHGERSRWARHFDIDWGAGRLVLPFLPEPFEALLEAGRIEAKEGEDGPVLCAGELEIPLTPHPLTEEERAGDPEALRDLHARQAWRLAHWELERDGVTHRRFFNVTGLIGMRVEDPQVFDDTHALTFDLVRAGLVDALRVDHVDGLADPGAYLSRLREEAGECPIWIEKILVGDETLPDWPIDGTTGYECCAAIVRVLTDPKGLARIDALWREETGEDRDWPQVLAEAKAQVIRQDLAAELAQLKNLAMAAAQASGEVEAGEEALREAVLALLVQMPRYRTYLESDDPARRAEDAGLLDACADRAAEGLVGDTALRFVARAIREGDTEEARRLRVRFQQVTGALMAKSQEDTAFYRFTRCLAHCEVGGEPGEPVWSPARFGEWLATRTGRDLTLTSSHDTKRAEDARMRLVAMTHLPDAFARVWEASKSVDGARHVPAAIRWYVVQSLLALWEEGREGLADRLAAHLEKALREAREVTNWTHPREEAEARPEDFARALAAAWEKGLPPGAPDLIARADELSLAQLAIKGVMPGIPDFYQGAEGPLHHLTDPDNRLAVDWDRLGCPEPEGFAQRKDGLTRRLLALRAERPALFEGGATRVEDDAKGWRLIREGGDGDRVILSLDWSGEGGAEAVTLDGSPSPEMRAAE